MIFRYILLVILLKLNIYLNANNVEREGFVANIFNIILTQDRDKNIIISPLSVQTCVAMIFFASNGKTATEIENGLYLGTSDKQKVAENIKKLLDLTSTNTTKLNIANRIFINNNNKSETKSEFNYILRTAFNSETEKLDFSKKDESAQRINSWVEEKTNNKIRDLITPSVIDIDSSIILVNAIYFKAKWLHTFSRITKKIFWINTSDKVEVDMMHNVKYFKYAEYENLDAKAIEMKYKNSEITMMIILPNRRDGILELEDKLKTIDFIDLSNKMTEEFVSVAIPKFRIEFTVSLKSVLEKMGIREMFTESANFSNLFKNDYGARVSDVIHKAYINVDENGSEATAATYLTGVGTSGTSVPKPKIFRAYHPFVFLIKNNESVYFIGHIIKL